MRSYGWAVAVAVAVSVVVAGGAGGVPPAVERAVRPAAARPTGTA
ncbi:hypothetical protein ACFW3D_40965 [Streptomyces sp. NPDC058864]